MALTDKLTDIADAIRGKTGKTDKLSLDQMPLEIAGIVSGGGGGLAYDMGEFVLDADAQAKKTINGIPHALGDTPEFILVWTEDFADISADNPSQYSSTTCVGYVWFNGLTGVQQRLTSTNNLAKEFSLYTGMTVSAGGNTLNFSPPTSAVYCISKDHIPTADKIGLPAQGNTTFLYRAGVTYKYFVSKAWWNVGGVANA